MISVAACCLYSLSKERHCDALCSLLYQTLLAHNRNCPLIGWFEWQREDKRENDNQTIQRVHRRWRGREREHKQSQIWSRCKSRCKACAPCRGKDMPPKRECYSWQWLVLEVILLAHCTFSIGTRIPFWPFHPTKAANMAPVNWSVCWKLIKQPSSPSIISAKCEHANRACLSAKGANL